MRRSITLALAGSLLLAAAPAGAYEFHAGDLVISLEGAAGNGSTLVENNAAPITLVELSHTGTTSATVVGSLTLPQVASGANAAVSGEYGSSSEGTLELSADGRYLTIAGYGVNAAAFNADPAAYGAPTSGGKANALAQSTAALVPRVAALIDAHGNVDSSTALTNVFDTNNPRSVATVDGSTLYLSGQGSGTGGNDGVFVAARGATTATPIATANDTRTVMIVGGKLFVSQDYNGAGGAQNTNISQLSGPGGGLPTSAAGLVTTPVVPVSGASVNLSLASENGINNVRGLGNSVYLSPENYFFASPTVLYVADSGSPKNGNAGKAGVGVGGLQKWVYDGGKWNLDYTLYAGLSLVNNDPSKNTAGTTGLYGLTGQVDGDTVDLFATNYTIGGTDQTYLYGITDSLSNTAIPGAGEQFSLLYTAPADTTVKGVAFAPSDTSAVPEPASLLLLGVGLLGLLVVRRGALAV